MPGTGVQISIRRWVRVQRARCSLPRLLADRDETVVLAWVSGINGGMAILTVCLLAWATGLPMMFPALGPTAFILMSSPFAAAAAPRSVVVGHFAAIATGALVWQVASELGAEVQVTSRLELSMVCVAFAALSLTAFVLVRLDAPHAPACASALIVALGGVTGWQHLLAMAGAVVVLTLQAVAINHLAGVNTPFWSPKRQAQSTQKPSCLTAV